MYSVFPAVDGETANYFTLGTIPYKLLNGGENGINKTLAETEKFGIIFKSLRKLTAR